MIGNIPLPDRTLSFATIRRLNEWLKFGSNRGQLNGRDWVLCDSSGAAIKRLRQIVPLSSPEQRDPRSSDNHCSKYTEHAFAAGLRTFMIPRYIDEPPIVSSSDDHTLALHPLEH